MTMYFPTWGIEDLDAKQLLGSDHPFEIPPDVAVCPYCGGKLRVYITGLVQKFPGWSGNPDQSWSVHGIDTECDTEPDMQSPEWGPWLLDHSDLPGIYQVPAEEKIIRWINRRYRIQYEN